MKKPNVILISIDTLRADHLSCYGYHRETTPNIDKIASDGTIFRRNYSTGVWTPPGHASMLTGLYVSEHGVYGENRLNRSIPTIAETLKAHGYQTAGFVNNSQVGELVGFEKGHDTFVEVWKGVKPKSLLKKVFTRTGKVIREKFGYEDLGANRTNKLYGEWMKENYNHETPFYVFLHYAEPHNPLNPPRPYKNKYIDRSSDNLDIGKIKKVAFNPLICFVEDLNLNQDEIEYLKSLYDGEIGYIDSKIAEVIRMLKENNCYDDTMIIITADHGEHFGEHDLWSHTASLYNEVLHIPLIIKFPKGIDHIREVEDCTQLVDIFPTIMEITGVSEKEQINTSGSSLVCNGNRSDTFHEYIFAEWEGRIPYFIQSRLDDQGSSVNLDKIKNKMWMISDGKYKYISMENGGKLFFDVINDIKEQNNLVDQYKEIASEMKEVLNEWKKESDKKFNREQREVDEETKKNLEALGYI